jgi:hypothetical protein
MGGKIPAHPLTAGEGNPMMEIEKEVGASSISRVCQKAGELGRELHFSLVVLHSGIPLLECVSKFPVEHTRAHL